MSKTFLPDDYSVPKSDGKFAKIETGENKFVVCDSVTLGWIYWNTDNKPVRLQESPKTLPMNIRIKDGKPETVKHFWAFPVYNMETKQVQILELTQKTLMGALQDLAKNKDWGDPILNYQITISKKGEKLKTEYQILPVPLKMDKQEIAQAYEESDIEMDKFFEAKEESNPMEESNPYDIDEIADAIKM